MLGSRLSRYYEHRNRLDTSVSELLPVVKDLSETQAHLLCLVVRPK